MATLLIAVAAGVAFILAYHTYGRWLGSKIFRLSADFVCPSHRLRDDNDYVPTRKSIVFGHHFTSIAGTGPIVGPAIAVMWGWLPALLWVVLGSIFIGAVHDFGALVVSLRNNGQTVGDIAGRVLNPRVRLLFLFVLFMALTIVLAIFGLVIANVFKLYPASIFPCVVQVPIAVAIGIWLHRKGVGLLVPSIIALALMYLTVVFGDQNTRVGVAFFDDRVGGALHAFNMSLRDWPIIAWVAVLLVYSYIASVLPVWTLLQPRDYINSLQLLTALGLVMVGLCVAAFIGGAPPVPGAARQPLELVAPVVNWNPSGAPLIFPFLFITIACGAISGFHCLVSSGTSSKQLQKEPDARFVGYGSMLTEGFLATIVILACVAGLGLGVSNSFSGYAGLWAGQFQDGHVLWVEGNEYHILTDGGIIVADPSGGAVPRPSEDARSVAGGVLNNSGPTQIADAEMWISEHRETVAFTGAAVWPQRYHSWSAAGGLAKTVGAFVDGSANFLKSLHISNRHFPAGVAVALMGVLVASFAGTTLDTACRLQRYVVQELAATFLPARDPNGCPKCGYDLRGNVSGACPECGWEIGDAAKPRDGHPWAFHDRLTLNPLTWLRNKHGATLFAIAIAFALAALPAPGSEWSWQTSGGGGMILWPMFGATNQLLGGLAFMVIAFYLWRRRIPVWFLVLPLIFMLIMPAWAMIHLLFVQDIGSDRSWLAAESKNWPLIVIALATLVLEAWMIVEALLLWPRARGVLEAALPPEGVGAEAKPA